MTPDDFARMLHAAVKLNRGARMGAHGAYVRSGTHPKSRHGAPVCGDPRGRPGHADAPAAPPPTPGGRKSGA